MRTWLVIDCHYLAHRAFHTTKGLSHKGEATGVIFGFLKTLSQLKDELQTDHVAFCFEGGSLKRKELLPEYKLRRHKQQLTDEEKAAYEDLMAQLHSLRTKYLPAIGFQNIFCVKGYESDDLMAKIAADKAPEDEVILVTGDSDLWQCLKPGVMVYSPKDRKLYTDSWFRHKHGLSAKRWAVVKAIAGCQSDEVPGIKGVGDATAVKFLRGGLTEHTKAYQAIVSKEGKAIIRRNRKLVELPYEGTPSLELREDDLDRKKWVEVCHSLGMMSMIKSPPIAARRLARILPDNAIDDQRSSEGE